MPDLPGLPDLPTIEDVLAARLRLAPAAHRTPVITARSLDEIAGAKLFFKCENLQRAGAFKFRGAYNAVAKLVEEGRGGPVATHSSGNHGAALALAAKLHGLPAHIVMPTTAPAQKRQAVEAYGGRITWCEPTLASRIAALERVVAETSAEVVHPYDDVRVIAGQGTAALELLEDVPELDAIVVPVGGGGLASGTAIATAHARPSTKVIGAEPEAADDAFRSLRDGRIHLSGDPVTIADGLRTSLSERTFAILRDHAVQIVTVPEAEIAEATKLFRQRTKLVIEPSSAVPVAAVLARKMSFDRIGIVLSGGNADLLT